MPQIHSHPDEQVFNIRKDETILYASIYAGIPHIHACGGRARCSTCRILIIEGQENCCPRSPHEEALAQRLGFSPNIRLACQTKVTERQSSADHSTDEIVIRRLVLDLEDEKLANDQVKFGKIGEEKSLAILFSDIRGFTKLSETMLPFDVIYILNRYFQAMGEVIDNYNGVINNYMGDGFMALFGIDDSDQAAENAVRAALKMVEVVESLNSYIDLLSKNPLKVGIGIHYGNVVLGAVGTRSQKNMTAIGDAVNFASRIESANKDFGTTILISSDVYELVKAKVTTSTDPMPVEIRGKTGTYSLYEVLNIELDSSLSRNFDNNGDRQNKSNYFQEIWQLLQTKIF